MRDLYPQIEPFNTGELKVSEIHTLYYEQVGNPQGTPVIFLHGGPGGGIWPDHRRFFDPKFYHVILFDQRGCGKSRPTAEIRENTTWDLIQDIETLRQKLGIKQWHVFGGSWGSTLALTYAISHPDRVSSLVLRGIFLCRPSEISWFYQHGASEIFPDRWDLYWNHIQPQDRHNMVEAYYKLLTDSDFSVRLKAAKVWSQWEAATSRLIISDSAVEDYEDPNQALSFARIECHYFLNNSFFPTSNYLLENISKIRHLPARIIQGRYDVVCPVRSAWDLHKLWPESSLIIVPDCGHAASEPGIRSALIDATDELRFLKRP